MFTKDELEGKVSEEESSTDEDGESDPRPVTKRVTKPESRQEIKPSRASRRHQSNHFEQTRTQTRSELIEVIDRVVHLTRFQPQFSKTTKSVDGVFVGGFLSDLFVRLECCWEIV